MQSEPLSDNKRIAKNTIFLYFRTIVILVVSLYTSRVILNVLGVDDYSIYNVVGGVVTLLAFLNAALSNGSSRFLTYEMGKKEKVDVNKVFQSSLLAHFVLAIVIVIIAETLGLWFVNNKLVIAPERFSAAIFTYHISILTSLITIIQVPYTSMILAKEKMDYFAYVSVVDSILKLLIVFLLPIWEVDRLELYALLLLATQFIVASLFVGYCMRKFEETSLNNYKVDFKKIKEIVSFSSWSLFGNAAHALNGQGLTIVTNMFFSPAVVAARALSIQVNSAAMSLVQNLGLAANPQIVKLYSAGEREKSSKLLMNTARYSYMLILLISVPLITLCHEVLSIWLVEVPEYTEIFVQLILIQSLFFTLDTSFYTGLYACGRVRENALISPSLYFIQFVVVYFLFKAGLSPISLSIAGIITCAISGVVVKPLLLKRYANFPINSVYKCIIKCMITTLIVLPIPVVLVCFRDSSVGNIILRAISSFLITLLGILIVGLYSDEVKLGKEKILQKLRRQ